MILLSAFFSSAETALTTVNMVRIRLLVDEGNKKAAIVAKIKDNSSHMLSTILIFNNIVNLSASALTTTVALELFGSQGVGIATGILTFIIVEFSEITPKTIASINAEKMSLFYAPIIYMLMKIMVPVIFVIEMLSKFTMAVFGIKSDENQGKITESELRTIVGVSNEEGIIENSEYDMITNVFDFGDSKAKDVMVPRINLTFVNIDSSYDELIEIYRKNMFTRYPVYKESTDNVIGFINVKDLILYGDFADFKVKDILREPFYTYELKNTAELFMEMKNSSNSAAIVLDEFGITAGMVTLEDLLEEIVGEIKDEYDEYEEEEIHKISPKEYIVKGTTKIDDFNEETEISIFSKAYDSMAGYLLEQMEHLPVEGENFRNSEGILFIIRKMDNKRIDKIYIKLP
ncbi:Hemolysin, contains CBS domains [Acetitomaculum ruminis DSM 5522]|uniref:Hemolysin, contains CBS domains n=1 Tax=Acetitomaculum ruminis DSM 5522 TaxID=1120918 RepID=A0A1I0VQY3_9FIRM|nr:hemolysin family protein [Acetitomaculum ruminis]SFA78751.1 Hemolysin, contains CBS domains [Acetitomaculum ruminis DSM 5522]